jgi:dTDP-4-amino-4,6-dideoxygalactose transaminase
MSFDVIKQFEDKIAEFFGSSYAVSVDSCTHGVELCLRYTNAKQISVPYHTYLSIPFLADKLQIPRVWRYEQWADYYYLTDRVIDAAVHWQHNGYIPGTFMNISFQYRKHLNLCRGGMILTDNEHAALALKKMSYDGRTPDRSWREQNIDMMGYHYYMTPETAQLGLEKLPQAIATPPTRLTYQDYLDLTDNEIFKKDLVRSRT